MDEDMSFNSANVWVFKIHTVTALGDGVKIFNGNDIEF